MSVLAVYLQDDAPEVRARIETGFPVPYHYQLAENLYLVRTDLLTSTVAERLGIKGAERVEHATGVVFKLNAAYAGYANRAIWEWLRQADPE